MDLTEELLPCAEIHRRPFLCVELIQSTVTVKRPFESHWLEQFALEQGGIVGVIDKSPRPLRNIIPVQHGSRGRLRLPPGGLALPERAPCDLNQAAAIGVHLIEVGILVLPRQGAMREDDLRPIRRPGRIEIELIASSLASGACRRERSCRAAVWGPRGRSRRIGRGCACHPATTAHSPPPGAPTLSAASDRCHPG